MYNFRYRRCFCMNNNYSTNSNEEVLEDRCQNNCCSCNESYNDNCGCGFDDEYNDVFPTNPMLAQSYVPVQYMDKTFKPCVGLKMGTIFPELVSPYTPGQSMEEIAYIEATNNIREGCNKCQ